MKEMKVLGTRVDLITKKESLELIESWIGTVQKRPRLVVTAYSEFFVAAMSLQDFRMALEGADLVTPDGIGPLAAIKYEQMANSKSFVGKFLAGLRTGMDILRGRAGEPVSGYWLFGELVKMAGENDWRVFLLGGFGETASQTEQELSIKYKDLSIKSDAGGQKESEMVREVNDRVIEKINKFKPDLLFVAYGPVKQERWLMTNRDRLKVKVAMGVGGTFDEYLGRVKEAPAVMERYGLKWLWRVFQQPQRIGRIWKAVIVFPWRVFMESLRTK